MKRTKQILMLLLAAISPLLVLGQAVESFTFTTNRIVPQGDPSGMADVETVNSGIRNISSLQVRLKMAGEFNGGVYAYLRNTNGFVVLLNRVGKTTSNPYGYGDSGFDVTFQAGAANGDLHAYQNITTPAPGSPLTGTWDVDGRTNDPLTVTDLSLHATSLTNFNNFSAAGEWTLFIADLSSGSTNMLNEWGLDIAGVASPALSWANPADILYGTALSGTQLNAKVIYNVTNVPGTFTYSPPAGTVLSAGSGQTLSVTFTPNDTNSFSPVTERVVINVSPAPLTIMANNTTSAYGAALPMFTASYSGFVLGQGTNSLTALAALSTTATAASDVGTYPITGSGATAMDYTFSYVSGTLTITSSLSAGWVTSSANPASVGTNVTFSMAVGAVAPGAGTPTGTVNFRIDGNVLGSGPLSGGRASFTTDSLTRGTHTVVAEYAGDGNFLGSTNRLSPNQVIDTAPVAGDVTILRNPALGVQIRLTALLTNASDSYGDALNLVVSPTSGSNATVTVSGGWVFYTPPSGFTKADSFTYTVTDSLGLSATGTVTVDIQLDNGQSQNLTETDLGGGSILIHGNGIPGYTYHLQYSDTCTPFNWQDIESVTADSTGQFRYTDTADSPTRFYRTVCP